MPLKQSIRISAVTKLRVKDYKMRGNLRWTVATEKRIKSHEMANFLANGVQLEEARKMAGHKSAETTGIYNRNIDVIDPEVVMRIDYKG